MGGTGGECREYCWEGVGWCRSSAIEALSTLWRRDSESSPLCFMRLADHGGASTSDRLLSEKLSQSIRVCLNHNTSCPAAARRSHPSPRIRGLARGELAARAAANTLHKPILTLPEPSRAERVCRLRVSPSQNLHSQEPHPSSFCTPRRSLFDVYSPTAAPSLAVVPSTPFSTLLQLEQHAQDPQK